ncbi:hypothetical protein BZA77DRAFT_59216 [Pyronema omphalodes]|nr:hypothetical protein BZA77DRAFT_59216 [Pyronema omphalodes]
MRFSISAVSLLLIAPFVSSLELKTNLSCQNLENDTVQKALAFDKTGLCCAFFSKNECQSYTFSATDKYDSIPNHDMKIRSRMCSLNCNELASKVALLSSSESLLRPNIRPRTNRRGRQKPKNTRGRLRKMTAKNQ